MDHCSSSSGSDNQQGGPSSTVSPENRSEPTASDAIPLDLKRKLRVRQTVTPLATRRHARTRHRRSCTVPHLPSAHRRERNQPSYTPPDGLILIASGQRLPGVETDDRIPPLASASHVEASTPAADDWEERRRERSTRPHCQANASVGVDRSDAPGHRLQRACVRRPRRRPLAKTSSRAVIRVGFARLLGFVRQSSQGLDLPARPRCSLQAKGAARVSSTCGGGCRSSPRPVCQRWWRSPWSSPSSRSW
jgi:hypothetical protein